jgi:hypothetical protein
MGSPLNQGDVSSHSGARKGSKFLQGSASTCKKFQSTVGRGMPVRARRVLQRVPERVLDRLTATVAI